MKVLAQNKKAYFDYDISEKLEAGIVLTGDEVKSAKAGHISLVGTFATIHDGELYLINAMITPYERAANKKEDDGKRSRKLLVHRRELSRLVGDISRKGITIVALSMYLNNRNLIKVELGLAKHKKAAGKKEAIKERDIRRETQRELKKHR
jgi:SsrA-binding protein